jgi:probable blue pigment (indigoidine) exporter
MRGRLAPAAVAPLIWGTTYLATTELLPAGRPLLASMLRAVPAGLLLLGLLALRKGVRQALPTGPWRWRSVVLGLLNIALFFPLLFVSAYRLPGGIAAVAAALGPFVVALLAYPILGVTPSARTLVAAAAGVCGVALLVLTSAARLDPLGLAAAAGGLLVISLATVLGRAWGMPPAGLLALTGWQLMAAGLALVPAVLLVEGLPGAVSARNVVGFAYLSMVATVVAYLFWFRAVTVAAPTQLTLLVLLSPIGAATLGWVVLGQALNATQLAGAVLALGAVALGASGPRHAPADPAATAATAATAAAAPAVPAAVPAPRAGSPQ